MRLLLLVLCAATGAAAQSGEWGAYPTARPDAGGMPPRDARRASGSAQDWGAYPTARPDAGTPRPPPPAPVATPPPTPPPPTPPPPGSAPADDFAGYPAAPQAAPVPPPAPGAPVAPVPTEPPPDGGLPESRQPPQPVEEDGHITVRGGIELGGAAWPASPAAPVHEAVGEVRPLLSLDAGDDFALEAGATLRMLIAGTRDARWAGGVLRKADWDESSDFGQIFRMLRVAKAESTFWVRLGAVRTKSLGHGHLIARYSNQENPDYHPTSAEVGVHVGAFRGELFASDMFGARLVSGELRLDVGSFFGPPDRLSVAAQVAHDFGRAGGHSSPATLFHLDASYVFFRGKEVRLTGLIGFGGRGQGPAFGGVAGVALDATLASVALGARVEARKQAAGFRQGFFGAGYEVARFSSRGFSGGGIADEQLPDAFSFAFDFRADFAGKVFIDAFAEPYTFGRLDLDARFGVSVVDQWVNLSLRVGAMGLLTDRNRVSVGGEARVRLFASFYLYAQGGTLFFPQPGGVLFRGIYGGGGVGFDFEKGF